MLILSKTIYILIQIILHMHNLGNTNKLIGGKLCNQLKFLPSSAIFVYFLHRTYGIASFWLARIWIDRCKLRPYTCVSHIELECLVWKVNLIKKILSVFSEFLSERTKSFIQVLWQSVYILYIYIDFIYLCVKISPVTWFFMLETDKEYISAFELNSALVFK